MGFWFGVIVGSVATCLLTAVGVLVLLVVSCEPEPFPYREIDPHSNLN
jgi:hypothetical protein